MGCQGALHPRKPPQLVQLELLLVLQQRGPQMMLDEILEGLGTE